MKELTIRSMLKFKPMRILNRKATLRLILKIRKNLR
jgi:predicted component of type VI protein secretion system